MQTEARCGDPGAIYRDIRITGRCSYLIHAYDSADWAQRGLVLRRRFTRKSRLPSPGAAHASTFSRVWVFGMTRLRPIAAARAAAIARVMWVRLHAMDTDIPYLQRGRQGDAHTVVQTWPSMDRLPGKNFKVDTRLRMRSSFDRGYKWDARGLQPLPNRSNIAAIVFLARAVAMRRMEPQAANNDIAHSEVQNSCNSRHAIGQADECWERKPSAGSWRRALALTRRSVLRQGS